MTAPMTPDRLAERCDRLAGENLAILTRYNVAISQRAQALCDLNRLALGIAVKLDVPSGVPDRVHVDSLIAAVAGVLHELAKARNDAAVDATEIERLRALPVMDVCNRCDDCMPTDHDTGEAACTHPKIGERAVVANAAPPSWCPLRGGER